MARRRGSQEAARAHGQSRVRRGRGAGLGVTAFGLSVMELPPNADRYPEHTHGHDGQEEVYTVLEDVAGEPISMIDVRAPSAPVVAR